MKCDRCDSVAVIHITEIRRGLSSDRHLCEKCAETLLPLEESQDSDFLGMLPPKDAAHPTAEGEPTRGEESMTGVRQQVVVVDLATGARLAAGPRAADSWRPVWSPDSKRLAMCHGTESLPSLAVVEPGTKQSWHFLDTTFSEPPAWSCDSHSVAFSHEDAGLHVVAANLDTGGIQRIGEEADSQDFLPAWSPKDGRLAFVNVRVSEPEARPIECGVDVARPGTDDRRRFLTSPVPFVGVGWSADARFVAAASPERESAEPSPATESYTIRCARSERDPDPLVIPHCLTAAWAAKAAGFSDGPAILAVLSTGAIARTVLIDPDSRKRRTLADDLSFPAGLVRPTHLSSDGRLLAALRGIGTLRIAILDLSTGALAELDPRGEVAWLSWLPGTRDLAALIREPSGVRLDILSPTGPRRTLTAFPRSNFFDAPSASISPDGKRIAVEAHIAGSMGESQG